jgi:ADP-ribose pyrophosphatase YjhB (NUDIX family)
MDGRLRPVCPACGHIAYHQLKVGAGVLVEREGALLLAQRSPESKAFPGTWNLPAGYCEADEPPPSAAAREAAEETGLEVQVGRLVDIYFFDDDPRGNGLLLVYEAAAEDGDLVRDRWRPESTEVKAAGFYPADQLPEPLCGGGHDRAIEAWRRQVLDRWQPGAPLRFCPHCAHPLEEQMAFGRHRPVCLACGFVHFRDPKVGISVLVEHDGQVLLVQRGIEPGLGQWCLPAGFIDWDEAPTTAAARECAEETGLTVTNVELLEAVHYTQDFRGPGINLLYRAQVAGGTLRPGDDATAVRWFSPAGLPPRAMIAFHSHYVVLEQWRQG